MVLMAGASDSDHHHPTAKTAPAPPAPASPSPSPSPAARTRLHGFSFPTLSWGTHRLLRCSKDGASASASASPPLHPQTPSPEKEKPQGRQGSPGAATGAPQPPRPWNLRTRRSATAAPARPARSDGAEEEAVLAERAPAPAAEAKKRGFSVVLSKEEIAEDFVAIRGSRPPRRPKKRPRTVQRQLDLLYPGLSLADVTPGSYKIEER